MRKRAGVCVLMSLGLHNEPEFPPLIWSMDENVPSLELRVNGGEQSLCAFNVICIAAYQLLIEMLTILGTG